MLIGLLESPPGAAWVGAAAAGGAVGGWGAPAGGGGAGAGGAGVGGAAAAGGAAVGWAAGVVLPVGPQAEISEVPATRSPTELKNRRRERAALPGGGWC